MDLYVDVKYLLLLSSKLDRYVRKSEYLWNFRCPFCGDSTVSKLKARGYVHRNKKDPTKLSFRCHNCQQSMSFSYFLRLLDSSLYKEYRLERFRNRGISVKIDPISIPSKKLIPIRKFDNAVLCSDLMKDHFCAEYLSRRMIPEKFWNKLYYSDHYNLFVNELIPDIDKEIKDEPRLVIPYFSKDNEIFAVTGRSFSDKGLRYITLRTSDTTEKLIYGLDRLDNSKKCYILEGPLDSLFLPNAIASGDSNLISVARSISNPQVVLVYDNERRNAENIGQLELAINEGFQVVIWPDTLKKKDINFMIESGKTSDEIKDIIDSNTVSGLRALVKLKHWKRS